MRLAKKINNIVSTIVHKHKRALTSVTGPLSPGHCLPDGMTALVFLEYRPLKAPGSSAFSRFLFFIGGATKLLEDEVAPLFTCDNAALAAAAT